MRTLLFELGSGGSRGQSLERLLTTLVDAVRARTQLDISLQLDDDPELPEDVIQAFYRISREALNNAIVHSGASQVTISLISEPHFAELRIRDDGRGFDPEDIPTGHLGIGIMTERASQIGGDLQVISAPGQGTEIGVTWSRNGGESGEYD
jgi:signal transduction histidine kinase